MVNNTTLANPHCKRVLRDSTMYKRLKYDPRFEKP